jgi:hypothetical protein
MFICVLVWAWTTLREGLISSVRKMYLILLQPSTRVGALPVDKRDTPFHNPAQIGGGAPRFHEI